MPMAVEKDEHIPLEEALLESMTNFLVYATRGRARVRSLEGPIDVPTVFHTFVGIFPYGEPGYAVVSTKNVKKNELYDKILGLELPSRLKALGDIDDPDLSSLQQTYLHLLEMPSIALAIGETLVEGKEAIYIVTADGITPETGLAEIKSAVQKQLREPMN